MTGEEMERAIEFLLQGQAHADARIAALAERQDQTDQQITEMSQQIRMYAETQSHFIEIATRTMPGLAASQERTDRKIAETNLRLAETNARTEQRIAETNARIAETDARFADRLAKADERTEQLITAIHARITETDTRVAERMAGSRALADETNARLAQHAAIQAETNQRLNRLTALMERIIADGNGDLEQ
jgi:chromosome segregation ATPase